MHWSGCGTRAMTRAADHRTRGFIGGPWPDAGSVCRRGFALPAIAGIASRLAPTAKGNVVSAVLQSALRMAQRAR